MGWKSDRHGLQVQNPKDKVSYILIKTASVKFIYKCYHGHNMNHVPSWGPELVKKLENWETKGWSSSLVGMTPIVSKNTKHIALFNKKRYQMEYIHSESKTHDKKLEQGTN